MAAFIVHTYQFSPIFSDTPSLFSEDRKDATSIWENKQKVFSEVFDNVVFKYRNSTYDHETIYNENDIIVIKIANNKSITQENSFITKKLDHHPSCVIIFDNRKDVQNVYIEDNTYSFSDTSVVANILQSSFNLYLKNFGLSVVVNKRFKTQEFWQYVSSVNEGITMLRFCYLYPNLPRVQEKIDEALARTSGSLRSKKTTVEYNAGENESLNVSDTNTDLNNLVEAASISGNDIKLRVGKYRRIKTIGETSEVVEIDDLEASLSSDLLSTAAQKLLSILNRFK